MGDRAMAEIKTNEGSFFVYTHQKGSCLPGMAREAIRKAKPRWLDMAYATRIIVDQLTKSGRDLEGGFGLMLKPNHLDDYNNDKPSVIIDLVERVLTVIRHGKIETFGFEEICSRSGDSAAAMDYNARGIAKVEDGDLDGALADFTKAIELDPKYVIAYLNRSVIKHRKGDYPGSRVDFDKALELDPEYFKWRNVMEWADGKHEEILTKHRRYQDE